MKVVKLNRKNSIIKAIVKSYGDLFFLQYIVEKGDRLIAYSRRKITVGDSSEIKTIKIGIEVEKQELGENSLEVSGRIFSSSDEKVPMHKYHTISIKAGTGFILQKSRLLNFQISLLKQAVESTPRVFICVYEEGSAIFYMMSNYRLKKKMEFKEEVSGKRFKNESRRDFFRKLGSLLAEEYKRRYTAFIVAGKALDNEELRKEYLKGLDIIYETVSYADTGLKELLSRDTINEALKKTKLSVQRKLISEYLTGISNNNKEYVYGMDEINKALSDKKPLQALLSKEYVLNNKEILEKLDRGGCEIIIFDENDDSLSQLLGFGGILVKFTDFR